MRRDFQLVCCAFSFCWYHQAHAASEEPQTFLTQLVPTAVSQENKVEKKKEAEIPIRPQVSWPKALRAVRAWLEPWVLLQRFWQAWSTHPPSPQLQTLVDCLGRGQALFLYGTDLDSFAQSDEAGLSLHPFGR